MAVEDNMKNTIKKSAKNAIKKAVKVVMRLLRPFLIKAGIVIGIILFLAGFVWAIKENLFSTGSSNNVFNSGGTTYLDEQTEETLPLIGINKDGTMWVMPRKTVDYIRKKIMETSDIIQLNFVDNVNPHTDIESEENREKANRYLREFLIAEQVSYYPNLEY